MIDEKTDKKKIIILIILIIIIILAISITFVVINNKKKTKDNNTEIKENLKEDELEERFKIPENDDTVLYAGELSKIVEKINNYESGKRWKDEKISLGNGINAQVSCKSWNGIENSTEEFCEKIKIQINKFTVYTYNELAGCGDGTYIIVTKDHLIKHNADGCGSGLSIEMDDGIEISKGPTNLADAFDNYPFYIRLNNNKVYYMEYGEEKKDDKYEIKLYAYDIKTGKKELMDTYYDEGTGQM